MFGASLKDCRKSYESVNDFMYKNEINYQKEWHCVTKTFNIEIRNNDFCLGPLQFRHGLTVTLSLTPESSKNLGASGVLWYSMAREPAAMYITEPTMLRMVSCTCAIDQLKVWLIYCKDVVSFHG